MFVPLIKPQSAAEAELCSELTGEVAAEAHSSHKKFATLLFTAGTQAFALPHTSIEAVLPLGQLLQAGNLPPLFEGFISYKTALIPCLQLGKIYKMPAAFEPQADALALILKPEKNKSQSKLALLIDRVATSFWASESHFVALNQQGPQHPSLNCGVSFGSKTYSHIHVPSLLQSIETLCLGLS